MYQLAVTNPSHWTNHQFTIIIIVIKAVIIIITVITIIIVNINDITVINRVEIFPTDYLNFSRKDMLDPFPL